MSQQAFSLIPYREGRHSLAQAHRAGLRPVCSSHWQPWQELSYPHFTEREAEAQREREWLKVKAYSVGAGIQIKVTYSVPPFRDQPGFQADPGPSSSQRGKYYVETHSGRSRSRAWLRPPRSHWLLSDAYFSTTRHPPREAQQLRGNRLEHGGWA